MSDLSCTIKLEFDSAKRLREFQGKCNYVHGYNHVVEAKFINHTRGKSGEVVDFYKLKEILHDWLDKNFDHNILLNKKDKKLGDEISKITKQKPYYFNEDPSAENIAEHLLYDIFPKLFKNEAECISVKIYDSSSAWVEAKK